ncbi:universal stress protein [Natronospirillum operosum]|uniref:Universal stress protein n=1 Tax=Natronospirillum operosum TaxID=2759953 RepID=A0A4Z0WDP7_9GAMM|nr:universal stress protein [Natronospirillum operosum]TGG93352.1 universal stress protein [Natronospirillum operosum]
MTATAPKTLLVPVDGSEGAIKALRFAVGLGKATGAAVDMLYAFPRNAYELFGTPAEYATQEHLRYMDPEAFGKLRDDNAKKVFAAMRKALGDDASGIRDQILLEGDPGEAVIKHADAADAPMIIVGSRGISRVRGLLIGSVSQRLAEHAHCPVTVVR